MPALIQYVNLKMKTCQQVFKNCIIVCVWLDSLLKTIKRKHISFLSIWFKTHTTAVFASPWAGWRCRPISWQRAGLLTVCSHVWWLIVFLGRLCFMCSLQHPCVWLCNSAVNLNWIGIKVNSMHILWNIKKQYRIQQCVFAVFCYISLGFTPAIQLQLSHSGGVSLLKGGKPHQRWQ